MRKPRGFGKKYFSLSSILAYAVAQRLHGMTTTFKNYYTNICEYSSKEEEESPPDEELTLLSCFIQNGKACHCDCVFRKKTRIAVALFKFIPRCPYYCKFFAFRRTGTHPPYNPFN